MFPILVTKFKKHEELKETLLFQIKDVVDSGEVTLYESNEIMGIAGNIADFDQFDHNVLKPYWKTLYDPMAETMADTYSKLNLERIQVDQYWFQQYVSGTSHRWHLHPATSYSSVYYLEMPEDGPNPEFILPVTNVKISVHVEEGDVLTFPNILMHRSPPNPSEERKTVIVWNIV